MEAILGILAELRPVLVDMTAALKELGTRIGKRDYELVRRISFTVRLLAGEHVPSRTFLGMLP